MKKPVGHEGSLIGVLFAIMVTAIVAGIAFLQVETQARTLMDEAELFQQKTELVKTMHDVAAERLTILLLLLLEEDPFERDSWQLQHMGLAGRFVTARNQLMQIPLTNQEQDQLETVFEAVAVSQLRQAEIRDLAMAGSIDDAQELLASVTFDAREQILKRLDGMTSYYQEAHRVSLKEATETTSTALRMVIALTFLALLVISMVGIYLVQKIRRTDSSLRQEVSRRREAQAALEEHQLLLEEKVKQRTAALEESEARTLSILDNAPECIVTMDETGAIRSFNPAGEDTFGYTPEEVLDKQVTMLMPAEFQEAHTAGLQRFRETGEGKLLGKTVELEGLHKDGSRFPLELKLGLMWHSGSYRFIGMIHDITERKMLESQLLQAQKLESVGQLAAGIAHEINTPTQYVSDNTTFLQDAFENLWRLIEGHKQLLKEVRDGEIHPDRLEQLERELEESDLDFFAQEVPSALEQALEGLTRISTIVSAMKEFSHPGSKEKESVSLNRLLKSTATVSGNEWKYIADLTLELDENLPEVSGYAGKLGQVFLNLIVNAAHAIADLQEKSEGEKGKIHISTRRNGGWAEVSIRDSGPGVPESIRQKIFDPFFTTKGVGRGTGQGLSIAHSVIVDQHAGELILSPDEGCGAEFVVRLPL